MDITQDEQALCQKIGLDLALASKVKDLGLGDFKPYRFEAESENGIILTQGICLSSNKESGALKQVRQTLLKSGFQAYYTDSPERFDPESFALKYILVISPGENMYQILKNHQTNGCNCDFDNAAVMAELKSWETLSAFEITGVALDWLELQFSQVPQNLDLFGQRVYEFCPDTIEQGYVGEPLGPEADFEDYAEALDEQTPADIGRFVGREKTLYLWWD